LPHVLMQYVHLEVLVVVRDAVDVEVDVDDDGGGGVHWSGRGVVVAAERDSRRDA
jgi:hypothetical protein